MWAMQYDSRLESWDEEEGPNADDDGGGCDNVGA